MHELAITESVVATVAERLGDSRVAVVTLEIGRLSGVMAESIRFCFDVCSEGTTLAGARLDIREVPGRARCRTCQAVTDLPDLIALCSCGSADLDILSGQELRIKQVEVV